MVHAGLVPYQDAWDEQRRVHAAVAAGTEPDTVLLLEHPPVYTAGKRTSPIERPQDGSDPVGDHHNSSERGDPQRASSDGGTPSFLPATGVTV